MRWLRVGFLPASLLVLVSAALFVPLPLYLERPGRSVSLASCVEIGDVAPSSMRGDFVLMTINLLRSTTVDAVASAFDDASTVVAVQAILPPGTDADAFFRHQRDVFAERADIAAAVGLEAAGVPVDIAQERVAVDQVQPGTPADGVFLPGDVIRSVNDERVETEAQLRDAITAAPRGQPLEVEVVRDGRPSRVSVTPAVVEGRQVIGVHPRLLTRVELPVDVSIASGPVGGPSAGLTIALTVYDKVAEDVDLAAGRLIAGTGTLDAEGRVGAVGGAGLKVVAAERLGADVFLVPAANLHEATAAASAGSPMQIVPVTTFEQARDALMETAGADRSAHTRPAVVCGSDTS